MCYIGASSARGAVPCAICSLLRMLIMLACHPPCMRAAATCYSRPCAGRVRHSSARPLSSLHSLVKCSPDVVAGVVHNGQLVGTAPCTNICVGGLQFIADGRHATHQGDGPATCASHADMVSRNATQSQHMQCGALRQRLPDDAALYPEALQVLSHKQ
jgi:hypothetical protein